MKIDLPITIIFDCQATDQGAIGRAAGKIIGTLQYDTEGDGTDALFFSVYPPPEKFEAKYVESGQSILAHIPAAADKLVNSRAAANPYDYMVGTEEERTAAQAKVDAEQDPTP
jgi:hypothetical protein